MGGLRVHPRRGAGRVVLRRAILFAIVLVAVFSAVVHQEAGRSSGVEGFVGDFEVGPPGWQQFDGLNYEEDRPVADSYALVGEPVRQGRRAARLTVRQGYSRHGYSESTQLVFRGDEHDGDEYWYAWSTLFPREWTLPDKFGIFAEWHANLDTSPIIGFSARRDSADLTLLSGLTDETANGAAVDRVVPLLSTLSKGRWNDFVMHVRWSSRSEGLVEVFHRVAGTRSLRKLVSFTNVPTFQVTTEGKGVGTYLLVGIYRGSYCPQPTQLDCSSPRGVQPPSTLYHDGFVRARTYAAAVTQAFPSPTPHLPSADSTAVQTEGARMSPVKISAASHASARQVDRGCSVDSTNGQRVEATIVGAEDDRDTAVVLYRLRQRETIVIRQRLSIASRRLAAPLVVTQLRVGQRRVLAELYVDVRGTLRLSSPPGTLRPQGLDIDTGIAAGPGAESRTIELRLRRSELLLGVNGRLVVRLGNLDGPGRGSRLTARIGIDRYDGRAGGGPIRALYDELVVATS